jgi:hypothetical protein
MPSSLTRRQALQGGAMLALWRLLTAPRGALAREAAAGGALDVTIPVPARLFSRRARDGNGRRVTPPLRAARRLDLIGLRWSSPCGPRLELRVRRRGRWGPWIPLSAATGHRPDARTREAARGARRAGPPTASEAVAVGGARVFQLRADRPVDGLRVHGIAAARRPFAAPARAVRVQAGAPAVITRAQWGAQAPRETPDYGEVQLAFVHHTVTANDYSLEESASIVRSMQHYHRNVLGWDDIGYNLLVDRFGQVFEGRAGGIDQAVIGAQAQGYNSMSSGIAVIGTHTSLGITSAAFEALAAVLAWKLSLHALPTDGEVTVTSTGGPLNRYGAGTPVRLRRISGHRDGDETECPGGALYRQLPALRARAGQLVGRFAQATGLALEVTPRRVGYLEPTTVSGTLRQPDGSPAARVAVDVQARSASGWGSVASAVTDPAGAWSTSLALPYTRPIRAAAAPSGTPLTSATTRLEVRSAVTPRIRPVRMRLGRRTVLSGRVAPGKRRQRLVATIERRLRGGGYVRVARLAVTARSGRFRLRLRPTRPGLYRVRLSVPGDRLNVRTRSDFVFARVRR